MYFTRLGNAIIVNNSVAPSGLDPSSSFIAQGLRVPDGKSLLLVGGDIQMDGGNLYAFGGRVELGGLAGVGTVRLNEDGQNLSLSFPNGVERSDVFLSNGALVDVIAGDRGSIAINTRNLEITGGSALYAGIASGISSDSSQAGDIDINATAAINLKNGSSIFNYVQPEAQGRGGNVNITTNTLLVQGESTVAVLTLGAGKAGSLTVDAQDILLIGTNNGLLAYTASTGDAGDVAIKTSSLLAKDGAQVTAGSFGTGKGGSVTIDAQDIQLIGTSADNLIASGLFNAANSTGNAGDLTIKTDSLLVKDGAQVATATRGAGKGGLLTVEAQEVQLIGRTADDLTPSGLIAASQQNSTGDAGNLILKANSLLIKNGAQIFTGTAGSGKGGSVAIEAQDVQLIGTRPGQVGGGLFASSYSQGNAGNLTLKTDSLLVKDGAAVNVATVVIMLLKN